ncbi:MAG: dethiobiotin synthase [Pseudomonadota bacterium]
MTNTLSKSRDALAVFVTGTDTDCGKTLVASSVVHGIAQLDYKVVGMKPVASGSTRNGASLVNDDVEQLKRYANVILPAATINPYIFEPPISPHFAAEQVQVDIDIATISNAYNDCCEVADIVVVEGAGGWHVPLTPAADIAALVAKLDIPVVLVCGLRLGCINHAVLSANAILASNCRLVGWVANLVDKDYANVSGTIESIRRQVSAPLLGSFAWQARPNAAELSEEIDLNLLLSSIK